MEAPQDDSSAPPKQRSRLWRWVRRIAIFGISVFLLLVLIAIFAGPRAARYGVQRALASQGLTGELETTGNWWSSFGLSDVALEGNRGIRVIDLGSVELTYDLERLWKRRSAEGLDGVVLKDAKLVLDLDELKKEADERRAKQPDEEPQEAKPQLGFLKHLVIPITIENASIEFSRGEKVWKFEGVDFNWEPTDHKGTLSASGVTLPGVPQVTKIEKCEVSSDAAREQLTVRGLALAEEVDVREWKLTDEDGALRMVGDVTICGSDLDADITPPRRYSIKQKAGELDLSRLVALLGVADGAQGLAGICEAVDLTFEGDFDRPSTWDGKFDVNVRQFEQNGRSVEMVSGQGDIVAGIVAIERLATSAEKVRFGGSGTVDLASTDRGEGQKPDWKALGLDVDVDFDVAEFGALRAFSDQVPEKLIGGVVGTAKVAMSAGKLSAIDADLAGRSVYWDGVGVETLEAKVRGNETKKFSGQGRFAIDEANAGTFSGSYDTSAKTYAGKLSLAAPELARLQPMLKGKGFEKALAGRLDLSVGASGDVGAKTYSAKGVAKVGGLSVDGSDPLKAEGEFDLAPDTIKLASFAVQTGDLDLRTSVALENQRAVLQSLEFRKDGQHLISGNIDVPLDLKKVKSAHDFLNQPGTLAIGLDAKETQLQDLLRIVAVKNENLRGSISGRITGAGTLAEPLVEGDIALKGVSVATMDQLQPADAVLNLRTADARLWLDGTVTQQEIEPISIRGNLPFRPKAWTNPSGGTVVTDEALDFAINLPESSLERLGQFAPMVSRSDGTVAADIQIRGTVKSPEMSGTMRANVAALVCKDIMIPQVRNLKVRLGFEGNRIRIDQFDGNVSGGDIKLSGSAVLDDAANPNLDLRLVAKEALLYRADDLNFRSDGDLRLTGRLANATLSGEMGLTNCRYVKEVDVLPIAFPESTPDIPTVNSPRRAVEAPKVGIAAKPMADWKIDVRVHTKDPFRVEGNLARAEILADLKLGGTGALVLPTGSVTVGEGAATLPFCKLKVDQAEFVFSPETGFDPKVNFDGGSRIGQYDVRIHLYNRLFSPEYVLTSSPPLSQEDIMSLIATGATREQLTSGEGVAVAKSAKLLLDKVRQETGLGNGLTRDNFIAERTTVDIGQVNARTGEPTVQAQFRVTDQIYVLGDVDVEGDYRGVLKWVLRFR